MFHLIHGYRVDHGSRTYIDNSLFGLEVTYGGNQHEGTYFLACLFDQSNQTRRYFAFDDVYAKERFERMLKIQGIGGKSAYQIAMLPVSELTTAVETFDSKYFQKLPGVGPKTAKRLLIELKQTLSQDDMKKLTIDDKLYNDITQSLKSLGYSVQKIKKLLPDVPMALEQDNIADIMKRLIDHL